VPKATFAPGATCCNYANGIDVLGAIGEVLIPADQTGLAGDNLVSVKGAEEDGVDNQVEAPSRASGDGS